MQNVVLPILAFCALLLSGCTTELLHSELAIEVVPDTAVGAQPYYAQSPQAPPTFQDIPDSLEIGRYTIGDYLITFAPYEGLAIWEIDSSATLDTLDVGFLKVEGFLDYDFERTSSILTISQYTEHYELDLGSQPPALSRLSAEPRDFKPYRFLTSTLGISGYVYDDHYLNCPDPDSILAGFRLETLIQPSCKYEQ